MLNRKSKIPIKFHKNTIIKINKKKNIIAIKGKLGLMKYKYNKNLNIEIKNLKLYFHSDTKKNKNFIGTDYSIIRNNVEGVENGFSVTLIMRGIGYKAEIIKNNILKLNIGFSHAITLNIPKYIHIKIHKQEITINGFDKQLVFQQAARIRNIKKPDPYKGKGIRYKNEQIKLKEKK